MKKTFPSRSQGFTLMELLAVLAIMLLMTLVTLPSISGILGSGPVNQAVSDLSGSMELARTYAMAHHTYVRVALGQASNSSGQSVLVALNFCSADGSETDDMVTTTNWQLMTKPLILNNFEINNSLNGVKPDTSVDQSPSNAMFGTLNWPVTGLGQVSFTAFIEFNPSGEAGIEANNPARFIKLAVDQVPPRQGQNPFILRVSGINGTIAVLRKENL